MKYLNLLDIQKQKNLVVFTKSDVELILNLSNESAKALINRYLKKGVLILLKKGLYYSKDLPPSKFAIANYLYQPSYISLNTALAYYGMIPEIVYEVTNITSKTTKEYVVNDINYTYRSIKSTAYTGYYKQNDFLIAYPEKALADYFYYSLLNKVDINERLKLKSVNKGKLLEYINLFKSNELNKWFQNNYDRLSSNTETIN